MPIESFNNIPNNAFSNKCPFLTPDFFRSLIDSKSVGGGTGWEPIFFKDDNSLLFTYLKSHSYGEYIFDWEWAQAYIENGLSYYPKLTSMIPFTSVTTDHFIGEMSESLFCEYEDFYQKGPASSSHFLFLSSKEISFFESYDYMIRESYQYHFFNQNYLGFEDFLKALKSKKSKSIRQERESIKYLHIEKITGDDLTAEHADEMHRLYLTTISEKNAIAYLKRDFFLQIFQKLKNSIYYVRASEANKKEGCLGGALYFIDKSRLYGRYWGSFEKVPNLHFELCYYQGIEICLDHNLEVFEAGAQGEHKIPRGFRPIRTYSAHKFKDSHFHEAIKEYIAREKSYLGDLLPKLAKRLPYSLK